MTIDPLAGRGIGAPERSHMLIATEDGVFLWPGIALVERRGNAFFALEPRAVNSLIGAFFGPAAIHTPVLATLERARDLLRHGQWTSVQRQLDRLLLPPVSPNGQRLMRVLAERHALAIPDVPETSEQSGTLWSDGDIESFARLYDDLWPRTQALEKVFNPGSAWDPAKHPRWPSGQSDGGQFRPNDGGGGASAILPAAARAKPKAQPKQKPLPKSQETAQSKPWEKYPNPAMRQKLAELESSASKPNNGYAERNKSTNALGRYQFLKKALIDAGWKNADGSWTEKAKEAGVTGDAQFLKNPEAQEKALTDVLQRNAEQLKGNGAAQKIGTTVEDSNGQPLPVTESGLMAAAHKEGPKRVAIYLDPTQRATLSPDQIRNIEGRLRNGAGIPYDAAATAREANIKHRGSNARKR